MLEVDAGASCRRPGKWWTLREREAQCDPTKVHTKESATMALNQSALSDLLDALRAGGDLDVVR
jgi:hypothetical protein